MMKKARSESAHLLPIQELRWRCDAATLGLRNNEDETGWEARGIVVLTGSGNVTVRAYAICSVHNALDVTTR